MSTIFGVEFAALALADVERFLSTAGEEGLTWEAKGTDLRPEHVRIAASAFGNSVLGGYLIVGAERSDRQSPWLLTGVDVGEEISVWVSNSVLGMDERPIYTIAGPWEVAGGKTVAVISFRPSPTPPVITPHGYVYERLVGISPKVTDRASLARLFDRGELGRREAQRKADERAKAAIASSRFGGRSAKAGFVFAAAPAGGPTDRSALLFTEAFGERLRMVIRELGRRESVLHQPRAQMWQDRFEAWVGENDGFAVSGFWDGSVVVAYRSTEGGPALDYAIAGGLITAGWEAAIDLAMAIGGYGPTFATIAARARETGNQAIFLRRWIELDPPEESMLASITREFNRATGDFDPEPA